MPRNYYALNKGNHYFGEIELHIFASKEHRSDSIFAGNYMLVDVESDGYSEISASNARHWIDAGNINVIIVHTGARIPAQLIRGYSLFDAGAQCEPNCIRIRGFADRYIVLENAPASAYLMREIETINDEKAA